MMAQPTLYTSESNVINMTKVPTISGKQILEDPKLESIGNSVKEERKIETGPAEIGYQLVYPNISKKCAARCKKASLELKHYSGFDFLIQVSGELYDMLDHDTLRMLLFHELLKIDVRFKAKDQQWQMKVRKPDFADFYEINDKFGTEWYKTIQATASSLYDLDPRQESEVTA